MRISPPNKEDVAGGVDRTSFTALGGTGFTPEIWIMAPRGGGSTTFRLRSPLGATSKLNLVSNSAFTFSPELIDSADIEVQISANAGNANSMSAIKIGNTVASANVPIKVLAMKKRTVKLAVHKVFGQDEHGAMTTPQNFPTKAALETYLNEVFGRQVNTFFSVEIYEEKGAGGAGIDYDFAGGENDLKLNASPTSDPEQVAATPNQKSAGLQASANIDVWVTGGVTLRGIGENVFGAHCGAKGEGKILIDGDLKGVSRPAEHLQKLLLHVFAHEIGHVMTGDGHPDLSEGDAILRWKASSMVTNATDPRDQLRLMCSGRNTNFENPGKQLIKKEWVLIEQWLTQNNIGENE